MIRNSAGADDAVQRFAQTRRLLDSWLDFIFHGIRCCRVCPRSGSATYPDSVWRFMLSTFIRGVSGAASNANRRLR